MSSIGAGVAAGVLGLEGLEGLLFYAIAFFVTSALLFLKITAMPKADHSPMPNNSAFPYFLSMSTVTSGGLFKDLMVSGKG